MLKDGVDKKMNNHWGRGIGTASAFLAASFATYIDAGVGVVGFICALIASLVMWSSAGD